jgi:hypothetical protein
MTVKTVPLPARILQVAQNVKLGAKVASWSRPVGPTCPASCPFLSGLLPDGSKVPKATMCYAESIQRRYPNVARSWEDRGGEREDWGPWARQMRRELERCGREGIAVRAHVGGDFLNAEGRVDRPYLAAVLWALRGARPRPALWVYTHAWRELGKCHRLALQRAGAVVFASVHSEVQARMAAAYGYRLAVDRGLTVAEGRALPAWTVYGQRPALQCPEQRCGAERVTCSSCGFCYRGERKEAVIFDRH